MVPRVGLRRCGPRADQRLSRSSAPSPTAKSSTISDADQHRRRLPLDALSNGEYLTGWRLWLDQPLQVDTQRVSRRCRRELSGRTGASARAIASRRCAEKKYDGPAAELIVAVAAFNYYYLVGMMVMEKRAKCDPDPGADHGGRLAVTWCGPAPGSSARCWERCLAPPVGQPAE